MQHNDDNIYESLTRETPEIRSQSLDTVEAALRRELHNQHIDLFNVARAFRMIEDGLFRNLPGYKPGTDDDGSTKGLDDYYRVMPERLGAPKQTVSHMRKVASAINRHSMDFLAYDVDPKKVMTKLASLDRPLRNHKGEKDKVFEHLAKDTVREFVKYSRGSDADPDDAAVQTSRPGNKRTVAKRALVPASELSEEQRSIAEALSRKHQVRVFAASTPEYAKSLRHALHEHRQKVYAKLTSDAGANLPERDCLDFPETANLFDVEEAIRGYLRRHRKADAKIAIGVYRLGTEKVLRDQCMSLGYTRIRDYCNERLGIDSKYDWYRRIGAVLEEHKDKLKAEGFFLSGQLYKLYYLPAALKRADGDAEKNVLFRRLQSDSFREFKAFAEGNSEILDQPRAFASAVVERSTRALQKVAKIKERGMIPTVLEIESPGELTYITYYDAMNRPEPAADESSSETAAA